jgi:hypothetical protein
MTTTRTYLTRASPRDIRHFESPHLWVLHPFLPLIRRAHDADEPELGILYDARGASGTYGYACTVFLVKLLALPPTEAEFFRLPKCVYDNFEELAEDGWVVD